METDTLVLAGGFMKGIPMMGFLDYLKPVLKNVNNYIGTSIGAMIAYLLAIGYSPAEIFMEYLESDLEQKLFETQTAIGEVYVHGGLFDFAPVDDFLRNLSIKKIGHSPTFRELYNRYGKLFICTGTKILIDDYHPVYFSKDTYPDLPCITGVKISCALPLFFPPIAFESAKYVDGGILDNFPILFAQNLKYTKNIIGIHVKSYHNPEDLISYLTSIISIPVDIQNIMASKSASETTKIYEIISNISACKMTLSRQEKIDFYSQGYNQAKKKKSKIKTE